MKSVHRVKFEEEALPHLEALLRTALWLTDSQQTAEDLVAETMSRAYRSWPDSAGPVGHKASLFRTLSRERFQFGTRKQPTDESPLGSLTIDAVHSRHDVPRALLAPSDVSGEQLNVAMARLEPQFRLFILLSLREQLSYADIAYITDLQTSSVKTIINRLYDWLRPYLVHGVERATETDDGVNSPEYMAGTETNNQAISAQMASDDSNEMVDSAVRRDPFEN